MTEEQIIQELHQKTKYQFQPSNSAPHVWLAIKSNVIVSLTFDLEEEFDTILMQVYETGSDNTVKIALDYERDDDGRNFVDRFRYVIRTFKDLIDY